MRSHSTLSLLPLLCILSCNPTTLATDLPDDTTTADETTAPLPNTTSTTTDLAPTTTAAFATTTTSSTDASDASTTTNDTTTTEHPSFCGDAHVDPGEQCDHGPGNGNSNSCTALCQYAVCGDRLIELGQEECDAGPDNQNDAYNECGEDCLLGPHCGDATVDADHHEECDLGPANGSGTADGNGIACSKNCSFQANIVFLTSVAYPANELGGAAMADLKCQHLALHANLFNSNNFHAWLSDDASTPLDRLGDPVSGRPYVLVDGRRVAVDREALLTTGPEIGITRTELGAQIFDAAVWTDTAPDGHQFAPQQDCAGWDSSSPKQQARVGRSGIPDPTPAQLQHWKATRQWTSHVTLNCSGAYRLYCFEGDL